MKNQNLLMFDGFQYKNYTNAPVCKTFVYKVIAILDENESVFKGIGISSSDCDLEDMDSILKYIAENYKENPNNFSLITGYFNEKEIRYMNILSSQENHKQKDSHSITFGNFERSKDIYIGRERINQGGLRRDLSRLVNQYKKPTKVMDQQLYDFVEAILLFNQNNILWQGIQYSIECLAPVNNLVDPIEILPALAPQKKKQK